MLSKERWRPMVGREKMYEVSSFGSIRRIVDITGHAAGTFLHQSITKRGGEKTQYRVVQIKDGGRRRTKMVHRIVAEAFLGPVIGLDINHLNGDGLDNRVENLEICTRQENAFHARRVLGRLVGEKNGRAKLTESLVIEIRKRSLSGESHPSIGGSLGVSAACVFDIVKGRRWAHVA